MFHNKKYFLSFFLTLTMTLVMPCRIHSQVWEDFSDGDFTAGPHWTGDTGDFQVNNDLQLQLYADGADSSQLSFPYLMPLTDTVSWQFWIRLAFSPTANNYAMVALYSDSSNLLKASHYLALAIIDPSAGGKHIALYQDDSLLMQTDYSPSACNNPLRFRIRLIRNQLIALQIDTIGDPDQAVFADDEICFCSSSQIPDSAHFGLYCRYTSSRAHHFYFDDIGINANSAARDTSLQQHLHHGDIIVNEILFNPPPGGSDYVELYNRSDSSIAISRIRLAKMDGNTISRLYPIASKGTLPSHDYFVVTADATWVAANYSVPWPSKMVEMTTMPAFNDASGIVTVCSNDSLLLDRFDYNEKMHSRLLRDREGVALERRSFNADSQEASNWYSAASVAGFGTPTASNSQSHEFLFADNDFDIAITLFSPDGDGYNDLLDITWDLNDCSLSANVSIFDVHGRLVRKVSRGATLGCSGVVTWDGTDDNGLRCPRGNYLVIVEAYNESGARQDWRRTVSLVRQ